MNCIPGGRGDSYDLSNLPRPGKGGSKSYYLQKAVTKNGVVWSVKSTGWPKVTAVWHKICGQSSNYIEGLQFQELAYKAANDQESDQHQGLVKKHTFTIFARETLKLETAEHRKVRVRSKWQRIAGHAAKIGRGLAKDEKALPLKETYWVEAAAPDHMYAGYLEMQLEAWGKSDTKLDFTAWRQETVAPSAWRSRPSGVTYLDEQGRKEYEISFSEGHLQRKEKTFVTKRDAPSREYGKGAIFVISPEGKMYSGSYIRGEFHHSSFLSGGAVMAAGEIKTNDDGDIVSVSTHSGHYRPEEGNLLVIAQFLQDKGVDISKVSLIFHSDEVGKSFTINAQKLLNDPALLEKRGEQEL